MYKYSILLTCVIFVFNLQLLHAQTQEAPKIIDQYSIDHTNYNYNSQLFKNEQIIKHTVLTYNHISLEYFKLVIVNIVETEPEFDYGYINSDRWFQLDDNKHVTRIFKGLSLTDTPYTYVYMIKPDINEVQVIISK